MTEATDRKRAKRREAKGLHWEVSALWNATEYRADGRALMITMGWQPKSQDYLLVAAETADDVESPQDVFADHAHQDIGRFETEAAARDAATVFAVKWLRGDDFAVACHCDNIADHTNHEIKTRVVVEHV